MLIYCWHVVACVYWGIGAETAGTDTWSPPGEALGWTLAEQYLLCLYWSVGTTGSISFPTPRVDAHAQRGFSLVVVIVGRARLVTQFRTEGGEARAQRVVHRRNRRALSLCDCA